MKNAGQTTGADFAPNMRLPRQRDADSSSSSNPMRAVGEGPERLRDDDDDVPARPVTRLTSPEKFKAQQLIASEVLDARDYPQFDDNHGCLNIEETEEELEIELNEQVHVECDTSAIRQVARMSSWSGKG